MKLQYLSAEALKISAGKKAKKETMPGNRPRAQKSLKMSKTLSARAEIIVK